MNRLVRRLITALLLGVLVYGGFVLYAGYREIKASLAVFHWAAFAWAILLATGNYGVRFLKWQYYLRRLSIRHVPVLDSLLIFLCGFVLTITPGKVGEVFKSAVLAKTHAVPAARTAPIVIAERLTDAIGVIVLIVVGGAAFKEGLLWALAGTLSVLLGMTCIVWRRPGDWLLTRLERRSPSSTLAPKVREALHSLRVVAGPAAVLWPTLLSVVAWALEGFALFLILEGFGAQVPLYLAVFFYATATLAGALVPVPGGLGVSEAMIQGQLVQLGGVQHGHATASMILIRFATLWWAVAVGFLALAALRLRFPIALRDPRAELSTTHPRAG